MKEALLKRFRVPAALLVVFTLLLAGTALAWYSFATIDSATDVQESISTTNEVEFSDAMSPGETNTWTFEVQNSAGVAYTLKADLTTFNKPSGVSITRFTVAGNDETDDLKDDGHAVFSISAGGTVPCSMTITADKDATPGMVSVSLALSRQ